MYCIKQSICVALRYDTENRTYMIVQVCTLTSSFRYRRGRHVRDRSVLRSAEAARAQAAHARAHGADDEARRHVDPRHLHHRHLRFRCRLDHRKLEVLTYHLESDGFFLSILLSNITFRTLGAFQQF